MGMTKKKKDKSDVDPLYERRRWRRRSTADFRHAAGAATAASIAAKASRSERQLPIVVSDSEDSSGESPHKSRRESVNSKSSVRSKRPPTRFHRAASRSFRGIWQASGGGGADGACDDVEDVVDSAALLLAASHHLQQQNIPIPLLLLNSQIDRLSAAAGLVSRFAMRRHAVMDSIRERIAGLRRRADRKMSGRLVGL